MDRISIDIIVAGIIYSIDCSIFVTIEELCASFNLENKYVYSLFSDSYYAVSEMIFNTEIKTGDIIFA